MDDIKLQYSLQYLRELQGFLSVSNRFESSGLQSEIESQILTTIKIIGKELSIGETEGK